MLKVLKVYRYRNSGKLIASGLGNGYVFPLNSDLSFSSKGPHRVNRSTEFDPSPYRIEVEVTPHGDQNEYRIIRTWDENHLPPKSTDPSAPLERRIDISPSQELCESEKRYVGQSSGHPIGFLLLVGSFFLLWMAGLWGWWPSIVAFVSGILVVWLTKTPGDSSKILEVEEAKVRLRQETEHKFHEALRDVRVWATLDGVGFERAVARIYKEEGFDVEFTPRTNDKGVDLILRKSGKVFIVQCKAYARNVGVSAVRELVGVHASWPNAEEAILSLIHI